MNYVVLILVLVSFAISTRRFGAVSVVTAGVAGFAIYSIPAIINAKALFIYGSDKRHFIEADASSVLVTALAWSVFLISLLFIPASPRHTQREEISSSYKIKYIRLADASLIIAALGYLYLTYKGGLLFVLNDRSDQTHDYISLIWRWCVILGLGASTIAEAKVRQFTFAFLLAIIFLRGDRTVAAIAIAMYVIIAFRNWSRLSNSKSTPSYRMLIIALFSFPLIIFGKPIYVSVKNQDFSIFMESVKGDNLGEIAVSLEPFVTFNHIETVISHDVSISPIEFISSVFGNALVIPSAFGVNTNLYNERVTEALRYALNYGIAGNYWAHALSVGGYPMVILFSALYAWSLASCDRHLVGKSGEVRLPVALIGALIAIYTHRNGLDNLLSFVRQIVIASLVAYGIRYLFLSRPRRLMDFEETR